VWERRAPLAHSTSVSSFARASRSWCSRPIEGHTRCKLTLGRSIIQEDLSDASVIFGVKQVPIDSLIATRRSASFSHHQSKYPYYVIRLHSSIQMVFVVEIPLFILSMRKIKIGREREKRERERERERLGKF